ncbi:GH25 family lysozyme [Streptomyces sp. NPDC058964]|uniref:GH25 family lysozyme n=1 Tax=Streptomyces sp. NPDC058964 TaxID=3346681 RepID=UPI0036AAA67D
MNRAKTSRSCRRGGRPLRWAVAAGAAAALLGVAQPAQARPTAPAADAHYAADHIGSAMHGTASAFAAQAATPQGVPGLDVSAWEGPVDWSSVAADGAEFAYVKATEGVGYVSDTFDQQYNGSAAAGLLHGAYHFALPDRSDGTTQADYFLSHGGGWSDDGRTLPGVLDIEYNPYGTTCYGLSQSAMVTWVAQFRDEYRARTGRYPMIYAGRTWWTECTGDFTGFASTDPLWTAHYASSVGPLPGGWSNYTIWQYADAGTYPGDQNVFAGSLADLRAFAAGDLASGQGWPTVRQGQSGFQVSGAQYLLNAQGAGLTVDGRLGPATAGAVRAFQNAHGLTADGVVSAATWQPLVS